MKRIYLDHAATTPVDPRVFELMRHYFSEHFGNPASRTHAFGWEAEEAIETARAQVAALLGVEPRAVVWTSGATESINTALQGLAWPASPGPYHLITTRAEHSAARDTCLALERRGVDVTWLGVDAHGRLDLAELRGAIRPETRVVSILHANNETGVVQDLAAIGALCRERGVLLHADVTQSLGKIPLALSDWGVDLASASAHKLCGPKGVGALYLRRRDPRVVLEPLLYGGGQERGLRSGTSNVPGIVGFGAAAALALGEMAQESIRVAALRDRLEAGLTHSHPELVRNGSGVERLPGLANVRFDGVGSEALLLALPAIALSAGSACASASLEPSHVLLAMGQSEAEARGAVRFSLGRTTTDEEIDATIGLVSAAVSRLCSTGG